MNERIKELADKANAWYPMGYPSGEGGDAAWENLVIFEKEDLEKFAKSIMKECIVDFYRRYLDICSDEDITVQVDRYVKEHFGVK